MGVLYARQKMYPQAADYFRKALEVDPTHQKARKFLEQVLRLMEEQ